VADNPPPAADRDARLERVLADYLHAEAAGAAPSRAALLAAHPDLAGDLDSFLANRAAVERVAAPLRDPLPLLDTTDGTPDTPGPGPDVVRYFGDYEILGEIARGGMGVVYKARQVSLNRVVALKMILRGELATPADVQRFRAEAEAAANLDHPNVVPIYEVGEHEGRHYFGMKLIDGGSLGRLVPELVCHPRRAARLMSTVARAVHHAHQHGLLHRDLKPANVLVDARGEPHVTDFGLAKRVEGDSQLTQSGAIVGTPSYMAPEQATGKKGLTVAADVYAVGAILYELLTGRPPFRGETALDTVMQVVHHDPPRPRSVNPSADRDLETIAMKCLEKDPARRYASVAALADDLDRWLGGRPILARRAGPAERVVKWARRQPVLAAAVGTGAAAAVGLVVLAGVLWRNAEQRAIAVQDLGTAKALLATVGEDRKKAEGERDDAAKLAAEQRKLADEQAALVKKQKDLAAKAEAEVKRLTTEADTARQTLEAARAAAARTLYAADMQLAHAAWQADNLAGALDLLRRYEKPAGDDPRGFEWHHLWRLGHRARLGWTVDPDVGKFKTVVGLAVSPDGTTAATADADLKVKVWSLADGKLLKTIDAKGLRPAALAFDDGGRKLVAASVKANDYSKVEQNIVGPAMRKEKLNLRLLTDAVETWTWTLAADGPPVVARFDPARVPAPLFPLNSGMVLLQHEGNVLIVMAVDGSADGKYLALAGAMSDVPGRAAAGRQPGELTGGLLVVWDVANARVHAAQKTPTPVTAVAFSADGKQLALGTIDGAVGVGTPDAKDPPRRLLGHKGHVYSLAFTGDGTGLFSGAADGHVIAWDVAAGQERDRFRGHTQPVARLVLSPDGTTLVTASGDGAVKVWDRVTNPLVLRGHETAVARVAFTPDGKELVSVDQARGVRTWQAADGKPGRVVKDLGTHFFSLAVAPNGGKAAWVARGPKGFDRVAVLDLATGKQTEAVWPDHNLLQLALSADGGLLAAGDLTKKGSVVVWRTADGKQLAAGEIGPGSAYSLAFSPDGSRVAATLGGSVVLWDWKAGTAKTVLEVDGAGLMTVAFSADGARLAVGTTNLTGTSGGGLRVVDLAANKVVAECRGAGQLVRSVAFSPDGRRVATAGVTSSQQGLVKLWDLSSGREVFSATLTQGTPAAVAFSPDGRRLAAALEVGDVAAAVTGRKVPGVVYVWDASAP
jgi:WD40 repeat protein/tRNA A-37 threonylcarbamoyl transferase component Bud32